MRTKQVTINGKTINVNEKRVKELKELYSQFSEEANALIKANSVEDLSNVVNDLLGSKITLIFPEVTAEDIDNAYPSELEEMAGAFIEVNFTGIKKAAVPFMDLILKGLQAK